MNEALRLYSSVPSIFRRTERELKLDKYTIPKDIVLVLPIKGVHLSENYWPSP